MKEAMFYKVLNNGSVRCELCPRMCVIPKGGTGYCGVRKNVKSTLFSLVYNKPCSLNIDPIEKKPLFHFAPGTECLSISTVGCNLGCLYCQNWEISHPANIFGEDMTPEDIVMIAEERKLPGISYTYTEPTIFYEFALDIMKLSKKRGLYNVWVSNGYTNLEPIKNMSKYLDAINIDVKGDANFYKKLCSVSDPKPIFDILMEYKRCDVWIEITNLLIPGWNDEDRQIKDIVVWVKENLGINTPIHFSAFHPDYKMMDTPPTSIEILEKAVKIAEENGMRYVYIGNVFGHRKESTYCWKCGEILIKRRGFNVIDIKERCPKCGEMVPIAGKVWMKV